MRKIVLLKFLLIFAIAGQAWAQSKTVTGRVTGPDGEGLPGVTVVERGTTNGMSTSVNGDFSLVVSENSVIVFSFIGFNTQEIPAAGRTEINVRMSADQRQLSELVVVGYGEQDRRTLTSSIATIQTEAIVNLATPSFDQQLAGRAAGVQVTTSSGILGEAPRIRIRGTNTISSGADPLIVVDNVPILTGNQSGATPTNPLADINPADIESIEVLKDGAATAIYGSRAANGVILITTKKGRAGAGPTVSFDSYVGFAETATRLDLLNADEFVMIANEKFANLGSAARPARRVHPNPPAGYNAQLYDNAETDWQDVIFRRGVIQNYALNFSGGTEKTNYYFSLGYSDQQGAVVRNSLERMTFRGNLDHRINRFLEAGTSLSIARTTNNGLNTGENALSGNVAGAARLLPNVPVYDPDNEFGFNLSAGNTALGPGSNAQVVHNNYTNLQFVLDNNIRRATNDRLLSNSYLQLNIVDGLTLRTQLGLDYLPTRTFQSWDPRHGDGRGAGGLVSQINREVSRWNWQNILSYNKLIGVHRVGLTLGNEYQQTTVSSFTAGGTNFSDLFFIQNGLISGTYGTQTSGGTFSQNGFDSYFGRVNYALHDRYLLGFSVRNDGLSSLPQANRRGTFLGGSLGWRLSEEGFYQASGLANTMNEVKFRASYGEVGNVDIGFFPYVSTYGSGQYGSQNGIAFNQAGNQQLQWESSKKIDFGVDLGFLENRFTFSFDYFQNNVDGIILDAPTPSSVGIPGNSISLNVGSLVNQGIELSLGALAIQRGNFSWNIDANFSTVDNKITSLTRGTDGEYQDILWDRHITRVGHSIGSFYGFESAGVNPANGNPMFVKGQGDNRKIVQRNATTGAYSFFNQENPSDATNTTGAALSFADVEDGGDRKILGNSNPTWFGGVSNRFTMGGFDLEVFTRFSGGNYIYNVTRQETLLNQDFQNNGREILRRWQNAGDITEVPRIVEGRSNFINFNGQAITRFMEKGDFVRIQNIVLGYRIPASILGASQNFPVRSVRVFAQAQNPFTFSGYTGLDPELNQSNTTNQQFGLDNNTNPVMRIYTLGINIGL